MPPDSRHPPPRSVSEAALPVPQGIWVSEQLIRVTPLPSRWPSSSRPTKYYVFYYTASWCGPCHRYTPTLVALYNKINPDDSKFELVLITNDRDEQAMTGYAVEANMPWSQLKLSAVRDFGSKFDHGVTGIPSVVVCDLEGNIVKKQGIGPNSRHC